MHFDIDANSIRPSYEGSREGSLMSRPILIEVLMPPGAPRAPAPAQAPAQAPAETFPHQSQQQNDTRYHTTQTDSSHIMQHSPSRH